MLVRCRVFLLRASVCLDELHKHETGSTMALQVLADGVPGSHDDRPEYIYYIDTYKFTCIYTHT